MPRVYSRARGTLVAHMPPVSNKTSLKYYQCKQQSAPLSNSSTTLTSANSLVHSFRASLTTSSNNQTGNNGSVNWKKPAVLCVALLTSCKIFYDGTNSEEGHQTIANDLAPYNIHLSSKQIEENNRMILNAFISSLAACVPYYSIEPILRGTSIRTALQNPTLYFRNVLGATLKCSCFLAPMFCAVAKILPIIMAFTTKGCSTLSPEARKNLAIALTFMGLAPVESAAEARGVKASNSFKLTGLVLCRLAAVQGVIIGVNLYPEYPKKNEMLCVGVCGSIVFQKFIYDELSRLIGESGTVPWADATIIRLAVFVTFAGINYLDLAKHLADRRARMSNKKPENKDLK